MGSEDEEGLDRTWLCIDDLVDSTKDSTQRRRVAAETSVYALQQRSGSAIHDDDEKRISYV